jgi:hypothetical protein
MRREFDLHRRTTKPKSEPFSSTFSSSHNFQHSQFSLSLSQLHQTIMFASNACRFAILSFLSLSANAETIRGAQRELTSAVDLGDAEDYAILAKSGITNVIPSEITGDIAVSPIAATSMTGFNLDYSTGDEESTSTQVTGSVYAASYGGDTPSDLTLAVGAMETAYGDASGRPNEDAARVDLGKGILGGVNGGASAPLTPGVYTFGTSVSINGDITFSGSATDVFIIQITGDLKQAADKNVLLTGGAQQDNIFWQVAGAVEVGADAHMEGVLLVKEAVTFITGSSLNGRVLTQTACNLQKAVINSNSA